MNQNAQATHGVLGQSTDYSINYDCNILYPIPRSIGRDTIIARTNISTSKLAIGVDWWHCFELSWLTPMGVSKVAMMRLSIPATSESIMESKSLKLYLNSLNFTIIDTIDEVQNIIEQDLSKALNTQITADIFELDDKNALPVKQVTGQCIDDALADTTKKINIVDDVDSSILNVADTNEEVISQSYHSHLLRSNCPVTNQPDWGTVQIDIDSRTIDEASLLEYILTYRQHNGFHEQCVEQIFADLTQKFSPTKLMVRAWYTRRGGIDINPCRVSDSSLIPVPSRLVRQ